MSFFILLLFKIRFFFKYVKNVILVLYCIPVYFGMYKYLSSMYQYLGFFCSMYVCFCSPVSYLFSLTSLYIHGSMNNTSVTKFHIVKLPFVRQETITLVTKFVLTPTSQSRHDTFVTSCFCPYFSDCIPEHDFFGRSMHKTCWSMDSHHRLLTRHFSMFIYK